METYINNNKFQLLVLIWIFRGVHVDRIQYSTKVYKKLEHEIQNIYGESCENSEGWEKNQWCYVSSQ